jgi:hypothetical protein
MRKVYYIAIEPETGDECIHEHSTLAQAAACATRRTQNNKRVGIIREAWYVVKVTQSS